MKLNSITPNASYDMIYGKPKSFEKDGDGTFIYRYNIIPEMNSEEGKENEQAGWKCRELRIQEPSIEVIKTAMMRSFEKEGYAVDDELNAEIDDLLSSANWTGEEEQP